MRSLHPPGPAPSLRPSPAEHPSALLPRLQPFPTWCEIQRDAPQGPRPSPNASRAGPASRRGRDRPVAPTRGYPHRHEGKRRAGRERVSPQETPAAFPFITAHLFGLESALS